MKKTKKARSVITQKERRLMTDLAVHIRQGLDIMVELAEAANSKKYSVGRLKSELSVAERCFACSTK